MTNEPDTPDDTLEEPNDGSAASEFERLSKQDRPGFFAEFWDFLKNNKKWWLLPILILMGVFGLLVFLAGTGLAPFLYPLF